MLGLWLSVKPLCVPLCVIQEIAIAFPHNTSSQVWINPESTPALARGGSGDVLAGMLGGLLAQGMAANDVAIIGTLWHSQTAIWLTKQRTEMGVDPVTLAQNLLPFIGQKIYR